MLTAHSLKPPPKAGEYVFPAVVTSQSLTRAGDIKLTMTVPWASRDEVFAALEKMPFACAMRLSEILHLDE